MADLNVNDIADAAGTGPVALYKQSAAKAWANFNIGSATSANGSLNISSLTDNGTGYYTANLTAAMGDANFSCTVSNAGVTSGGSANRSSGAQSFTTASVDYRREGSDGNAYDYDLAANCVTIHGDLA